jgi:large subunit ribosomal protein L21
MYAIVDIAGQQFKVEEGKKIFVHRLDSEGGADIVFDKVLLIEDGDRIIIGEPTIKDAVVEGKVLEHLKGDKVIVFKKKRKKGYRVKNGHRQYLTQVEIISIGDRNAPKKAKPAPKAEAKAEENVENVKEAVDKKTPAKKSTEKKSAKNSTTVKASATKKPASEKPAVKKATGKKPSKSKE